MSRRSDCTRCRSQTFWVKCLRGFGAGPLEVAAHWYQQLEEYRCPEKLKTLPEFFHHELAKVNSSLLECSIPGILISEADIGPKVQLK